MNRKIKILSKKYKLKYKDLNSMNECGSFEQDKITINNTLNKNEQISTLIHEIIECINYNLELDLEHNKINSLETGLFSALPDIIKEYKRLNNE